MYSVCKSIVNCNRPNNTFEIFFNVLGPSAVDCTFIHYTYIFNVKKERNILSYGTLFLYFLYNCIKVV